MTTVARRDSADKVKIDATGPDPFWWTSLMRSSLQ